MNPLVMLWRRLPSIFVILALLDRHYQAAGVGTVERTRRIDGAAAPAQFLTHPISLLPRPRTTARL
jgi:hypothetical protein